MFFHLQTMRISAIFPAMIYQPLNRPPSRAPLIQGLVLGIPAILLVMGLLFWAPPLLETFGRVLCRNFLGMK